MLSRLQMHQQVRRAQLPAGLEKKGFRAGQASGIVEWGARLTISVRRSFTLDSNGALPFIRIEVVMDPLAQHASKAANFLQVLHRAGAHIAVWLSSHPTYSLPPRLRSFYRFITDVGATTDGTRTLSCVMVAASSSGRSHSGVAQPLASSSPRFRPTGSLP